MHTGIGPKKIAFGDTSFGNGCCMLMVINICALGWVAATHWARVVAKATSHHGWGKNPGWN
jgi:hypothetical protein